MTSKTPTPRQRVLEAVNAGECFRIYTPSGNTLHGPKGVSATMLRHLSDADLIGDQPGGVGFRLKQVLTPLGQAEFDRDKR